jgi:type IV pilus assembly protein PilA
MIRDLVKRSLGFTLLEMMLVIAIIGVMATLAIPAYQDYMVRARVSEGVSLSMPARLAVHEYYSTYHALPENPNVLNFQTPEATMSVSQINIVSQGVVSIAYTEQAGNGTLLFTPSVKADGRLTWCCDGGTLAPKYRPNICKCH